MRIYDLFTKPLDRTINGVVKADQQDPAIVLQELDEYVITRELRKHFRQLIDALLAGVDNPNDPVIASKMAVWISGFFGSGKSHFLKILSYLLENKKVTDPTAKKEKSATQFFETKIDDEMFLADIRRAVTSNADVILFNIDSKADSGESRDALLMVFLRVFNEMQGFSGDYPHIAELERYLTQKGKYDEFQQAFKKASGSEWKKERDAYQLLRDNTLDALVDTLGMSKGSAEKWIDGTDDKFKINIEKLADKVKEYLDRQGHDHRIVFLVDEVGQFIGNSQPLMLNLQTICEELGTKCQGRAWVIVTSQEALESVVGECNSIRAMDFSKIQGRFATRLSLSSSNTDEVIQRRLLEKVEAAKMELASLYEGKSNILRSQLRFDANGPTLRNFDGSECFVKNYPFVPYQFDLLQDIFESIRQHGATGRHLSRGERSLLDAFQSAALANKGKDTGALIPLYYFYPSIESFLDTNVKATIDKAADISGIDDADIKVLQTLFLIRYSEKFVTGTVENLVTLFIDKVDADRIDIRKRLEASLQKLEKEHLISRHGDVYYFLTNEEQDVDREIKAEEVTTSEETSQLCEWIFDDLLKGRNKHRFSVNNRDYGFNRLCDGVTRGNVNQELTVEFVSPLHPDFGRFSQTASCVLHSSDGGTHKGHLLIRFPEHRDLGREIRLYKQTQKYINKKSDASAPETLKDILRRRADQNRESMTRIHEMLGDLMLKADVYALGQTLKSLPTSTPISFIEAGLDYLIENIYSKIDLIEHPSANPQGAVAEVLKCDDVAQMKLLTAPESNPKAIAEMQRVFDLLLDTKRVLLDEVVERFTKRPYGWPDWEVVLLVARLFKSETIALVHEGTQLTPQQAGEFLTNTRQWNKVSLQKRHKHSEAQLEQARKLGQELFGSIGPEGEDRLCSFLRDKMESHLRKLSAHKGLADTGKYPGKKELSEGMALLEKLVNAKGSFAFLESFLHGATDLRDLEDDIHDLEDFYTNQMPTWERMLAADASFTPNRSLLCEDAEAKSAYDRLMVIRDAKAPYGMIQEIDGLIGTIEKVNTAIVEENRKVGVERVSSVQKGFLDELKSAGATNDESNHLLSPLGNLKHRIEESTSVPDIQYAVSQELPQVEAGVSQKLQDFVKGKGKEKTFKPVRTVKVASLCKSTYIETEEQVKEFIGWLEQEMTDAVKHNHRIRIQ